MADLPHAYNLLVEDLAENPPSEEGTSREYHKSYHDLIHIRYKELYQDLQEAGIISEQFNFSERIIDAPWMYFPSYLRKTNMPTAAISRMMLFVFAGFSPAVPVFAIKKSTEKTPAEFAVGNMPGRSMYVVGSSEYWRDDRLLFFMTDPGGVIRYDDNKRALVRNLKLSRIYTITVNMLGDVLGYRVDIHRYRNKFCELFDSARDYLYLNVGGINFWVFSSRKLPDYTEKGAIVPYLIQLSNSFVYVDPILESIDKDVLGGTHVK